MRLWTLHPSYLDAKGLVAAWREALLAQAVLKGQTRGYRHHPQLARFRSQPDPVAAIAAFLEALAAEGFRRGYRFDETKIAPQRQTRFIPATRGQLLYEWELLKSRLAERDPRKYQELLSIPEPQPHPLFVLVEGEIEPWEVIRPPKSKSS